MELFVFITVVFFGLACLWAIHEAQERRIAKQGYTYYIQFSKRWQKKRKECFKHFYFKCALCGSPRNLQAHHITYRNLFNEKPGDLVSLCFDCHSRWAPKSKVSIMVGIERYSSRLGCEWVDLLLIRWARSNVARIGGTSGFVPVSNSSIVRIWIRGNSRFQPGE